MLSKCRICKEDSLVSIFNLGNQCLSEFRDDGIEPPKYPLQLTICTKCNQVQLRDTTPQNLLYTDNYGYMSGINRTMRKHLETLTFDIVKKMNDNLKTGDAVADIGCFPKGTIITMASGGTKDIADVQIGDRVVTAQNNESQVVDVFSRMHTGEMVTVCCGKTELKATKEHPIYTYNPITREKLYTPIDELKINDYVLLPRYNNKEIDRKLEDEYLIYGWYLAEGSILYSHKPKVCGISLCLCTDEEHYVQEIEDAAKRLGYNIGKSIRPHKHTIEIRIYSKTFTEKIIRLFGRYSHGVHISDEVFKVEENLRKILLRNYFRGEGNIRFQQKAAQYYISTRSVQLWADIKRMLIQLGAFPNIYEYNGKNDTRNNSTLYAVTLSGTDINVLEENKIQYKSKSMKIVMDDYIAVRVTKISKEIMSNVVYNLKVEGDNSYIANNIGVHNCNDGTLLKSYPTYLKRYGFDLVPKFSKYYEGTDIVFTTKPFGSFDVGVKFKVITAISMFYDLDDPMSFIKLMEQNLDEKGIIVIQQNYLLSMLKINGFDNIVHEHIMYHSMESMRKIIEPFGSEIFDVQVNDLNGGSFRTYICRKGDYRVSTKRVPMQFAIEREYGLDNFACYTDFTERSRNAISELKDFLHKKAVLGKTVAICGASTRGNTLLQACHINSDICKFAIERNPEKFGKKISSVGIPILSEEEGLKLKPDYLLVLPFFFKEEMLTRYKDYMRKGGKMIFPLPKLEVIGVDNCGKNYLVEWK